MAMACEREVGWPRRSNQLFSWGANSYGQLGRGDKEDQLTPKKCLFEDPVTCITGGGGHTLLMTEEKTLYACGSNNKGQLGLGHTDDVTTFTQVVLPGNTKVSKAVGGWDFTLILTEEGEVFVMGSNAFSQCASPEGKQFDKPINISIPNNERVVDIAAGLRHAVALTEDGKVYCWGAGKKGQCGIVIDGKTPTKVPTPSLVSFPPDIGTITQVTAGSFHSAAITDKGHILTWGCNKYGQCGQDPTTVKSIYEPDLILLEDTDNDRVIKLLSGWTHMLCLTEKGILLSWGRGDYGQLGRGMHGKACSHLPTAVDDFGSMSQVCCGSEHNLALVDGRVFAWGWNEHGICGTGDEQNVLKPQRVTSLQNVSQIGSGCGHSFASSFEDIT